MVIKTPFINLLLLFISIYAKAQYTNLKFENLSTAEGLSSSTCVEIFQDSEGFMWFGTIDGLNKYDGYRFVIYRPVVNDPNSISNNRINSIVEDGDGRLWVGTSNGLNLFDKNAEKFYRIDDARDVINDLLYEEISNILWIATKNGVSKLSLDGLDPLSYEEISLTHYVNGQKNASSIDNNDVTSILKDHNGVIWAGTAGKYLNYYDPEKDDFQRVLIDIPNAYELDHIPKVVLIDDEGDFWIGNDLSRLIFGDRENNAFRQLSPVKRNTPIFHIYQDKKGLIWVATDGYGIYVLDKEGKIIQHLTYNADNPFSLPNNQPSKVLEDKNGIFWIASYNKGVSKLVLSKSSFGHYFYQEGNSNSLSTKIAQSVMEDSKKRIWIGTDGGGLNLFNEKADSFQHFRTSPSDASSISSDKILYLLESHDGSIWVCTWDGGLNKFNPGTKKAIRYKHNPSDTFSIGQNTVWCVAEDSLHRVWLGTQTAGLNLFDPASGKFYKYRNVPGDTSSLISNFVFSLFIDSRDRLFVGTSLGLCVVDLKELDKYIPDRIIFREIREKRIKGDRINYITEDHSGNIWLGTDLGLHKLDADLKLLASYSTQDGLPNNLVLGIREDDSGNLWITTKSGLSWLDPRLHDFKNFNAHDGLQGMEFQSKSIAEMQDGRMLIGGINGFNIFNPADIHLRADRVQPLITGFKLFNRTVNAGDMVNKRVLLHESISNTGELKLRHNEGYIAFEYVALYYQNPERVQYAYRMKGLDQDFIYAGTNKIANYSSLPPGRYTFEVMASVDGIWENARNAFINIRVLPPPWKTWWAYLLYTLFFIGVFWVALWYYTRLVREEKEHELDQMKLNFFINVSHEFRTPLTLILNPIDRILSAYNDPEEVKTSAQTIQRSARRLLNLVNQLLDFRKMDLGKAPLETVKGDLIKFCKDIFLLFEDLAKVKGLEFHFASSLKELPASFDPDKVEKIITNLLSNAIKFTDSGSVTFSVSKVRIAGAQGPLRFFRKQKVRNYVEISVRDTGIGFKKEQLKDVFGQFFHVDNTKTGTGIGLNFTKGLVELHGGEILVKSEYGKGSTFLVRLPQRAKPDLKAVRSKEKQALDNYVPDINSVKSAEYEIAISAHGGKHRSEALNEDLNGTKRPLVLIVEDNRELLMHLKNELKHHFKVREAVNGSEGLEKVLKFYPDIIISDVMMPEMDGFELCRRVKNEIETCHIPVILLTARSLEEDRIEGYNTGADEYLPKPFNINVLRARINNLLEAKARLREKFASIGGILPSSELTSNSLDEVFLDKATRIVLENVSDLDFGLDQLLSELGVSRSRFYRKMSSLTGQNPSNFIRTIRLKYASGLLIKNQYSVKEIAYRSGFNSPAYFSKTFRELFDRTPNQFAEQQNGKISRKTL